MNQHPKHKRDKFLDDEERFRSTQSNCKKRLHFLQRTINMNDTKSHSPSTMAKVLVAFLSLLAELFSRFFLLALFVLYMVNLEPPPEEFLSLLLEDEDRTLQLLPSWMGRREPVLLSRLSSCLFEKLTFFFVWEPVLLAPRGGGDEDVEDEGPEVALVLGLGLEFISSMSWFSVLHIVPS